MHRVQDAFLFIFLDAIVQWYEHKLAAPRAAEAEAGLESSLWGSPAHLDSYHLYFLYFFSLLSLSLHPHLQFTVCVSIWAFSLSLCPCMSKWLCSVHSWQYGGMPSVCVVSFWEKSEALCSSFKTKHVSLTFTLGPQQPAGCPGATLGLFRGKESQRLNSSQQVGSILPANMIRLWTITPFFLYQIG